MPKNNPHVYHVHIAQSKEPAISFELKEDKDIETLKQIAEYALSLDDLNPSGLPLVLKKEK